MCSDALKPLPQRVIAQGPAGKRDESLTALRTALEPLVKAGLAVESTGEPTGYLLARDPHELTLEVALAAYERPIEELLAAMPQPLRDNLEALVGRLRENRRTTLANRSIVQLLG